MELYLQYKSVAFYQITGQLFQTLHVPQNHLSTINSSLPSAATRSALFQVMACCLFGAWNNTGLLSIGLLETNFSENRIGIPQFSWIIYLKWSSAKIAAILSRGRCVKLLRWSFWRKWNLDVCCGQIGLAIKHWVVQQVRGQGLAIHVRVHFPYTGGRTGTRR